MTRIDRLTMLVAATLKPACNYTEEAEIDSVVQRALRLSAAIESFATDDDVLAERERCFQIVKAYADDPSRSKRGQSVFNEAASKIRSGD